MLEAKWKSIFFFLLLSGSLGLAFAKETEKEVERIFEVAGCILLASRLCYETEVVDVEMW